MKWFSRISNLKKIMLLVGVGLLLFLGLKTFFTKDRPVAREDLVVDKVVVESYDLETVTFGEVSDQAEVVVLGTVESDRLVTVRSQVSGTLERLSVSVGDRVKSGQNLARFSTHDNSAWVSYQSALNAVENTKTSSQNQIMTAEIALKNAEDALKKTRRQQGQTGDQARTTLSVTLGSVTPLGIQALGFLDQQLGATAAYERQSFAGRHEIGGTNRVEKSLLREAVKGAMNQGITLGLTYQGTDPRLTALAQASLAWLQSTAVLLDRYNALTVYTVISDAFPEATRQSIIGATDGYQAQIQAQIAQLSAAIQAVKTTETSVDSGLSASENQVKSAQQSLELTRAQAMAQIQAAQNQVKLARLSNQNLNLIAPLSGVITRVEVNQGDLINPGQAVLTILDPKEGQKITSFWSPSVVKAWREGAFSIQIDSAPKARILETRISPQTDDQSQKIPVEISLLDADLNVGSLVRVRLIPESTQETSLLLPFAAVAFEPGGAEVLVVDAQGVVGRQSVVVGNLDGQSVEILQGLELGQTVVKSYQEAFPGEQVGKVLSDK